MLTATPTQHLLAPDPPHYAWDNSLPPKLSIQSGDTVTFQTRDAGDGRFPLGSQAVHGPYVFRGHPLTGPVFVEGAMPGNVLQVDILEVRPGPYGWTGFFPGSGLLSEEFPEPYVRTWDLSQGDHGLLGDRIRIPLEPFCGVMGLALAEPGELSTIPPRRTGGNMDIRQLVAGSSLFLPVEVEGGLFSVGDAHAAQGDGEVCVSAIEMDSTTSLRFTVRKDLAFEEPRFRTPGSRWRSSTGACYVTTAHGPDLLENSRNAVRYMLDHLVTEYGLTRADAYCLCSVVVDLKISQIVDAPNWIVSAFLPLEIFT
jgi:acetamidase/formamidase